MRRGPKPKTPEDSVRIMLQHMERESTMAPRSIIFHRDELRPVIKRLEALGLHTMPEDITRADVKALLDSMEADGLTVATRKGYIYALRTWCTFYGNDTVKDMRIRWPTDTRPTVDWLTMDDALKIIRHPKSAIADMVLHCELCLGMRRIEVIRLKVGDFLGDRVEILGKGSMGGKPRTMPYHRDTPRILSRWLTERANLITMCKGRRQHIDVPEELLIWRHGNHLKTFSTKGTGVDGLLEDTRAETGIDFSNHTLRRTFGRTMFRSGVAPATISKMLGHSSIDTTLKYIGVDMDDMTQAMGVFGL